MKTTFADDKCAQEASSFEEEMQPLMEWAERHSRGMLVAGDNPIQKIEIPTDGKFWDTEYITLAFLDQLLSGYIWACEHDSNFIASHDELPAVKRLWESVLAYKSMLLDPERDEEAFFGTRYIPWCFVQLSVLLPAMWD